MSSVERNTETYIILLVFVGVFVLVYLLYDHYSTKTSSVRHTPQSKQVMPANINLSVQKTPHLLEGIDINADDHGSSIGGQINRKDYETLIFDSTTGSIMTGSQFMDNTGIITSPWVPPAWSPDMKGPSASGVLNESDFDEDPRMIITNALVLVAVHSIQHHLNLNMTHLCATKMVKICIIHQVILVETRLVEKDVYVLVIDR